MHSPTITPMRHATRRSKSVTRSLGLFFAVWTVSGCTHGLFGNDPYSMPEILKAEMQRAQQNMASLRGELDRIQSDLAAARIAKAQLEGSLRDAERRVSESRQVIEFQREELSRARTERERVLATGRDLQTQLTALQSQLAEQSRLQQQLVEIVNRPQPKPAPVARARKAATPPVTQAKVNGMPLHMLALMPPPELPATPPTPVKQVEVKRGDTLHSISRQYRVNLAELAALNHITEPDRLLVGQMLQLPTGGHESQETAVATAGPEAGQTP